MKTPPLIAHIIFRFDIGGLENGLVNLINNIPNDKYRHVIICASEFTDFKKRLERSDVDIYALHKKPGNDFGAYYRLWKLLRKLKPDIVHTRNLGTIEYVLPALFAGVKHRLHSEHGRDMTDIDGTNRKYILLRQFYSKFIHCFIALSKDLESWLLTSVNISSTKVVQLYNGVDLSRFQSLTSTGIVRLELPQIKNSDILIGTVGRLQAEKDQATLIYAFALALSQDDSPKKSIKLLLIGDGPDRNKLELIVKEKGLSEHVFFLGARNDIPTLLAELDFFVLPSLGEGVSNTILEAMASGLSVVATNVGGNPELVDDNKTGLLVSSNNPQELAKALLVYINDASLVRQHGNAGQQRVESLFSMKSMIDNYVRVYDSILSKKA